MLQEEKLKLFALGNVTVFIKGYKRIQRQLSVIYSSKITALNINIVYDPTLSYLPICSLPD